MGGVNCIQTFSGFLDLFYIYKVPNTVLYNVMTLRMCLCMHVRAGVRASMRVCVRIGLIYACMIIILYNYICGRICMCVSV